MRREVHATENAGPVTAFIQDPQILPGFPGWLGSLHDAHIFCDVFFIYYNNERRSPGVAGVSHHVAPGPGESFCNTSPWVWCSLAPPL